MRNGRPLSGTQIIFSSLDPKAFPEGSENPSHFEVSFENDEPHSCALCGGTLTKQRFPVGKSLSSSWVTTQELEAKDEPMVCSACKWLLTGKRNRQFFIPTHQFVIFSGEDTLALNAEEFYHFLKKGFQYPCVIAVLDESNRTRKHVAWKLNRSISYSSEDVQVSLLSIETEHGFYDGTARFSSGSFLSMVDRFLPLIKEYRKEFKADFKNLWALYYDCLRWFHDELRRKSYNSENLFFAIYLACNMVFPFEERVEERKKRKASA